MYRACKTLFVWLIVTLILLPWQSYAQQTTDQSLLTQEQLEQLVAPIALYPDPLLAQILMASTYPLDIVSAARWVKANPNLKDKALEDALQQQTWDPSVKSLAAVPDVLNMMNEKLDMTTQLGDAFLAQQKDVLDAVQVLRGKAQAAGNLKSSKEQTVNTQAYSATTEPTYSSQESAPIYTAPSNIITIQPTDPQVVYVPTYDSSVVYGSWPYPAYPPYSYYPAGYYAGGSGLAFASGVFVGGALWGNCNWRNGNVNVNVNQYNRFNHANINDNNWRHDPAHRGNVPYRNNALQQKYGRSQLQNDQARDAFRNQADQGRQEMNRLGPDAMQRMDREGQRGEQQLDRARDLSPGQQQVRPQARENMPNRQPDERRNFQQSSPQRDLQRSSNAFEGLNHGGAQTRQFSNRGAASRDFGGGASSRGDFRGAGGGSRGNFHGGGGHGGGRR